MLEDTNSLDGAHLLKKFHKGLWRLFNVQVCWIFAFLLQGILDIYACFFWGGGNFGEIIMGILWDIIGLLRKMQILEPL